MTPEARRARAIRAKSIMDNDDMQALFDELEAETIQGWRKSFWGFTRERRWHELNAIDRVRSKLASWASQAPRD